ncbi:MAG TPA: ribonuclease III [Candidatus Sumerlaeota bacterium]|nr:ribonuclease III [Candidatus Sumerlaeota bacterium]HPK02249.1 ribonuclease III [Candidatus Sumerlaeota bacterium]
MTAAGPTDEMLARFIERHGLQGLPVEALRLALTHRSHAYEAGLAADNERLEFLGDAILAAVAAEWLYHLDPAANEGVLSKRRSRIVSRTALGRIALEMELDQLILLGRGERETGGARRRSTLGSALEAIVGAVYLHAGYAAASEFVRRELLEVQTERAFAPAGDDYKSSLQEWTQQHCRCVPVYHRVGQSGPDHDRIFTVRVEVNGRALAEARGRRIKQAENEAARLALECLTAGEARP